MVELILGDCLEIMPTLEAGSVDAVITDPPYGILKNMKPVFRPNKSPIIRSIGWDNYTDEEFYNLMFNLARSTQLLCSNKATSLIFCALDYSYLLKHAYMNNDWHFRTINVWHKNNPAPVAHANKPQQATEGIAFATIGTDNTFNVDNRGLCHNVFNYPIVHHTHRSHPTQKPIPLMEELILRHTNPDDVVLDPFMGVGSTGIACIQTGRNFIGIEIDKDYFAIAEKRITEAQLQTRMEI